MRVNDLMPTDEQTQELLATHHEDPICRLENLLLGVPQRNLSTSHVVHGGMCARTIFIPAGTVLTGARTNKNNVCILSGDITVTTDDGPRRLTGFHVIPAGAGLKRAGIAHADTHWTTVWSTALTEIEAIEDEMTDEAAGLQTRRTAVTYEDGYAPAALEN